MLVASTAALRHHPLIIELENLDLCPTDYAVFGSGPMFAHGLHEPSDLDVVARGKALSQAKAYAEMFGGQDGEAITFAGGRIEIYADWQPGTWNVDELIDTAEIVDGVPFVALAHVLRWKRLLRRPKDLLHCRLIEDYLRHPGR